MKTVYKKDYLQNTVPADYEVDLVKKGSTGFDKFSNSNTIPTHQKLESSVINNKSKGGIQSQLLKTGVEHWRTNYQKDNDVRNALFRMLGNIEIR